jgi:hypothetical protein
MGIGLFSSAAFWLLSYSSGSIELDRRTNLATMRAKFTAFLLAETASKPLSAVDQATLESQPNARRIRLIAPRAARISLSRYGPAGLGRRKRPRPSTAFSLRWNDLARAYMPKANPGAIKSAARRVIVGPVLCYGGWLRLRLVPAWAVVATLGHLAA